MKITIERGEGTTTVHIEGWGYASATNAKVDDPWLTTGRATNRMVDVNEGDPEGTIFMAEIADAGPVGRAAIRVMAASFMPTEPKNWEVQGWAEYWGLYYPDEGVSSRSMEQFVWAKNYQDREEWDRTDDPCPRCGAGWVTEDGLHTLTHSEDCVFLTV